MKGKHLLERVAARSGVARTAAKPVIDAVLVELHDALARGEMLLLPGLGKLKVKPAKEGAKGSGMQIKLLPIKPGKGEGQDAEKDGDTPLAPTED
jgi:DNA-binding protein HU-beta